MKTQDDYEWVAPFKGKVAHAIQMDEWHGSILIGWVAVCGHAGRGDKANMPKCKRCLKQLSK